MEIGVWFFSCRCSHYRMDRTYLVNPHWHQAIRFLVTTIPAVLAGWLLVKIRYYIMMLMALGVALFVVALVIGIIVSLV